MAHYQCTGCSAQNDSHVPYCPRCGRQGSMAYKSDYVPTASARKRPPSLAEAEDLSEVRISSGIAGVDDVLGGDDENGHGFVAPAIIFLTGPPGTGKSTLLLKMAALTPERRVLYNTTEEKVGKVKIRAKRLGLKRHMDDIPAIGETDINVILETLKKYDVKIFILDSFSKLRDPINDTRHKEGNAQRNLNRLIEDAHEHNRVLVMISHVNSEGEMTGAIEVQHDVDTILVLSPVKGTRYITLGSTKNRDGAIWTTATFMMTEKGLIEVEDQTVVEIHGGKVTVHGDAPDGTTPRDRF